MLDSIKKAINLGRQRGLLEVDIFASRFLLDNPSCTAYEMFTAISQYTDREKDKDCV